MKVLGVVSTTALFFLFGATLPAFAQEKPHEPAAKPEKQAQQARPAKQQAQAKPETQARPAKQQAQAKPETQARPAKQQAQAKPETQARPAKQQAQAKPETQARPAKQQAQARPETQARPAKQQAQAKPENQQQGRQVKQAARGNAGGQPQRSAADQQRQHAQPALRLSARGSGRIPDDRFQSNFGSEHRFRIGNPTMVDGYSRFEYGGFSFGFLQPWPVGWYYTDDVYVEYIDGAYYLCDPFYPGVRVGISVVI